MADFSPQARARSSWRCWTCSASRPACRCGELLGAKREAGAVQRDARGGRARRGGGERARWAERASRPSSSRRGWRATSSRCGGARGVRPEARIRVDANGCGRVDEAVERLERWAPLELAEQPVATLERDARAAGAHRRARWRPTRASSPPEDARGGGGVCDAATVKLAKVGGPRTAMAIARSCPSTSPARWTARSASRPRHTWRRRSTDAAWRTASRRRCCSPTRSPRGSAPCGTGSCTSRRPGLGVEIDEDALARCRIDLG